MSGRSGIAALIVLAAMTPAAHAQQDASGAPTVVGKFYKDDGRAVLYVITTKPTDGKTPKGALVGVEFEGADANFVFNGTYKHLDAVFLTAGDWRRFVVIWKKARDAHAETEDGYYFDGLTELGVGLTGRGEVSFTLAGNGHDERNVPKDITFFYLPPKDIPEFDRDVRRVSAYFAK